MARRFADAVMQSVTNVRGPFDTRIALVSTRGGRFKEIYTMSVDGEDLFRVTNNETINLFPSFDHQVRRVLYISYKSGTPGLYLFDLDSRRETHISSPLGNLIGGVLVPGGDQVVAAIEPGAQPICICSICRATWFGNSPTVPRSTSVPRSALTARRWPLPRTAAARRKSM